MITALNYIQSGGTVVLCGYKIKVYDLRSCLLTFTDLSGALYSFSIRVLKSEMPRRKLIIDVEMTPGFEPERYNYDTYLYELISRMKKVSRQFREFVRNVPADSFPELYFHRFGNVYFDTELYRVKNRYIL